MKPEVLAIHGPWSQRIRWVTESQIPIDEAQIECVVRSTRKPFDRVAEFVRGNGIEVTDAEKGEFEICITQEEADEIFGSDDRLSLTIYIQIPGLVPVRVLKRIIERA